MDIQQTIEEYTSIITQLNSITKYTVIFLIVITLITLILRILLSTCYQGQLSLFRFFKSSKKGKKSPLLNNIINAYKSASERGVASINTEQIVNKYIMKMNFIGWNFESINALIKKVETQAGFIGIATLFISDTDKLWCAGTTATMLVIFWLLGSIFDYSLTKNKLEVEIIEYVDNQEGIFYAKDFSSTILSFKNELQSVMLNTNKVLSDAIYKMNNSINESFKYGIDNMVKTTEMSMNKLVNYADILKEPMNSWKANIETASNIQNSLNSTSETLKQSMVNFETMYEKLDKQMNNQTEEMKEVSLQTRKQIEQLVTVVYNLDENSKTTSIHNEAVQKQLKYVEDNQQVLNLTLQKYQGTIENFTSDIGEVFGNIINMYSQSATESMISEIEKITMDLSKSNKELVNNINEDINKLTRQNTIQQQTISDIKEHLEENINYGNRL